MNRGFRSSGWLDRADQKNFGETTTKQRPAMHVKPLQRLVLHPYTFAADMIGFSKLFYARRKKRYMVPEATLPFGEMFGPVLYTTLISQSSDFFYCFHCCPAAVDVRTMSYGFIYSLIIMLFIILVH